MPVRLSLCSFKRNQGCDMEIKQCKKRYDWSYKEVAQLFESPFQDLLFKAQHVHRQHFDPNEVQLSTLLSIKTGACPEDCAYCPQSIRYSTNISIEKLKTVDEVVEVAEKAQSLGATRFCMAAAWRSPKSKDIEKVCNMVRAVKKLNLQTCASLGMLSQEQAQQLKESGLDFYNHNLDSSPDFYKKIISTRNYQQRIDTLNHVKKANIATCCGGIIGMGESIKDRIHLLIQISNTIKHPYSITINALTAVEGTPLGKRPMINSIDFIKVIAVARIMMPCSMLRLSAGRLQFSNECHALCFAAGANSIHYGKEKLLTTDSPDSNQDNQLLSLLGMRKKQHAKHKTTS